MIRYAKRHIAVALCTMLLALPMAAQTTGALTGRVVHDATNQPLAGVEVSIPALSRTAISDSSGRFALRDMASARYQIVLRKVGFQPLSPTVTIAGDAGPELILRLAPISTELSKVVVAATMAERRLTSFEEHRRARIGGSFLTAAELEKERGRSLSDVLQTVSGADIVRVGGTAYFATRRGNDSIMNMPGISAGDRMRGASPGLCYAAVIVNNVFVYRGEGGDELFDLNSLAPTDILAIEVYKGGATMPLEYNATRKTCGLLVIFTK